MNYSMESLDYRVLFDNSVFNDPHVMVRHFIDERYCVVMIADNSGYSVNVGYSMAHNHDDYNKKIARNIAYARALLYPVNFNMDDYLYELNQNKFAAPFNLKFMTEKHIRFTDMRMDHLCYVLGLTYYNAAFGYYDELTNQYFRKSNAAVQEEYMRRISEPVEHLLEK